MSADLFNETDLPFNLASEPIDNGLTVEGEARVRTLAEREARKAQLTMSDLYPILTGTKSSNIVRDLPPDWRQCHKDAYAYTGSFPRKRHAHRCDRCGAGHPDVACYKAQCSKGPRVRSCKWCRH